MEHINCYSKAPKLPGQIFKGHRIDKPSIKILPFQRQLVTLTMKGEGYAQLGLRIMTLKSPRSTVLSDS